MSSDRTTRPDIRRHPDGSWLICWEHDQQHWRIFENGTFTGSCLGPPSKDWRSVAVVDLPEQTDQPVNLPTLMAGDVLVDIAENFGIGLGIWYDSDGGASTRLSIGQARAIAAQLLAAADAYQQAGGQEVHQFEQMCSALRLIDRHGCTNYTRGRCWDDGRGRTRDAPYSADAWCDACVAADALNSEPASATTPAPELLDGYQPGCSNRRCQCWRPGAVCNEFMGSNDDRYCPRCGWARDRHDNPQPNQTQDGDR